MDVPDFGVSLETAATSEAFVVEGLAEVLPWHCWFAVESGELAAWNSVKAAGKGLYFVASCRFPG
jgi:hypothetical protein